jgi:LacI family transcriptional regulator
MKKSRNNKTNGGPQPARIKDVAALAGVSTATVSHVINNTKYVTDETRRNVLEAIEKANYHPNAQARSLALGRTNIIGLLVSDIANPFFPDLVKSIETAAFERGYSVILLNTNYDANRAADYVKRLIGLKVAGVALMTAELDAQLIADLVEKNISVVSQNFGAVGENMSSVAVDFASGVEEAVKHLASLGHRHIAHVAGPSRLNATDVRREAFLSAVARHIPDAQVAVYEGDFKFDGGRRAASEILADGDLPTAIFTANDMMAFGVMKELRGAGLSIPQDVSLVGFDDIAFAELTEPPLTTVVLSRVELGRRTVEALMSNIERPNEKGVEARIPTYLIKRGSTAPPRRGRVGEGEKGR